VVASECRAQQSVARVSAPQTHQQTLQPSQELTSFGNGYIIGLSRLFAGQAQRLSVRSAGVQGVNSKQYRLPRPLVNALTAGFAIIGVFCVLLFAGKILEGYRVHRYNAALQAEIAALEEHQEQLRKRLAYVQTSEYVETVAREQYKWTRDGETLVVPIFKRHPAEDMSSTPSPQPIASALGNPSTSTCYWPEWWIVLLGPFD